MPATITGNGALRHWVVGQDEPTGQFTAQVAGIPELRVTADSRAEAIERIRSLLSDYLSTGRLMSIDVPAENPLLHFTGHLDPNDPIEQEFVKELARQRREDYERSIREDEQECHSSSSTPTT